MTGGILGALRRTTALGWPSHATELYLSHAGLSSVGKNAEILPLDWDAIGEGEADVFKALGAGLQVLVPGRRRVRLLIEDSLLRFALLTSPTSGTESGPQSVELHALGAEAVGGTRVVTTSPLRGRERIAVSVPASVDRVLSAIARTGVVVTDARPLWFDRWNTAVDKIGDGAWVVCQVGKHALLAHVQASRLHRLRQRWLLDDTSSSVFAALVQEHREAKDAGGTSRSGMRLVWLGSSPPTGTPGFELVHSG